MTFVSCVRCGCIRETYTNKGKISYSCLCSPAIIAPSSKINNSLTQSSFETKNDAQHNERMIKLELSNEQAAIVKTLLIQEMARATQACGSNIPMLERLNPYFSAIEQIVSQIDHAVMRKEES